MSRNESTAVREWNSSIDTAPGTTTRSLIRALTSQADEIDDEVESIRDARHINTASGEALDRLGAVVSVRRKNNEADSKYRARIKAESRQSTIETTTDEFIGFCSSVLRTDPDNLSLVLDYAQDPARVAVSADRNLYNSINVSSSEIVEFFEDAVPAGHTVSVLRDGTFAVKASGTANDPSAGLTGDGTSDGGTLSGDL